VTIVAYRSGVMASDSATSSDCLNLASMRKITRTPNGTLVGAAGSAYYIHMFLEWAEKGFNPKKKPPAPDDFTGFIVHPDERAFFIESDLVFYPVSAPFFSLGSGADVALGAMAAGATAIKAVQIAIDYCHACKGPIQVFHLK
jgi:ATP-dependent protease HslVU (ClpYQ) peptidase subunit